MWSVNERDKENDDSPRWSIVLATSYFFCLCICSFLWGVALNYIRTTEIHYSLNRIWERVKEAVKYRRWKKKHQMVSHPKYIDSNDMVWMLPLFHILIWYSHRPKLNYYSIFMEILCGEYNERHCFHKHACDGLTLRNTYHAVSSDGRQIWYYDRSNLYGVHWTLEYNELVIEADKNTRRKWPNNYSKLSTKEQFCAVYDKIWVIKANINQMTFAVNQMIWMNNFPHRVHFALPCFSCIQLMDNNSIQRHQIISTTCLGSMCLG